MKFLLAAVLLVPSAALGAGSWSRALAPSLPLVVAGAAGAVAANLGKMQNLDGDFAAGVYAPLGAALTQRGLSPEAFAALPETERAGLLAGELSVQAAAAETRAKAVFRDYGREVIDRRLQRKAAQAADDLLVSPYYVVDTETRARLRTIGSYFREQADREREREVLSDARREMRRLLKDMKPGDWASGDDDAALDRAAEEAQEALEADARAPSVSRERRVENSRRALSAARGLLKKLSRVLFLRVESTTASGRRFPKLNALAERVDAVLGGPTDPRYATVDPIRREANRLVNEFKEALSQPETLSEDDRQLYRSYAERLAGLLNDAASSLENGPLDFAQSKRRLNQAQLWQARAHVQVFVRDISGAQDERFKNYAKDGSEGYYRDWKRVFYILEQAVKPSERPTPDTIAEAVDLAVPLLNAYRDAVKGVPQVKDIRGKKQAAAELVKLLYALCGQAPR